MYQETYEFIDAEKLRPGDAVIYWTGNGLMHHLVLVIGVVPFNINMITITMMHPPPSPSIDTRQIARGHNYTRLIR